jgi:tRNA A37 methylthiotransferase MiaB
MNILLIQPPIHDFYLTQKRTIPYGLACIAASLHAQGFKADIFDALATKKSKPIPWPEEMMYLHDYYGHKDLSPFALFHQYRHFGYSFQHIGKIVRESNAFLVGISSLFTAYSEQALQTAKTIKKWHPKTIVVMGGHHPTHFPHDVLNHSEIDYVIRGEGEYSLPALVKALKSKTSVDNIPGIAYKRDANNFIINEPTFLKNLDICPLPYSDGIKNQFYQRNDKKSLVVVASRGCPMKCSYCALGNSQWTYRKKSVGRIIEEISTGMGHVESAFIDFEDENISLNKDWFMKLLTQIQKHFESKHLTLRAMNGLYPSSLDAELIDAMKQAGFNALNLSVGTLSRKQLKYFKRPDVSTHLPEIIQLANRLNLSTTSYIIAGGLNQNPYDSVDDIIKLFQMGTVVGLSVFYPAPGSQDYDTLKQMNMLPDNINLMRGTAIPISHTTSRIQCVTLLRLTRIINYIYMIACNGQAIPEPKACHKNRLPSDTSREKTGKYLLSCFFHDAIIRGIDSDGHIFEHYVDTDLVKYFLKRLNLKKNLGSK